MEQLSLVSDMQGKLRRCSLGNKVHKGEDTCRPPLRFKVDNNRAYKQEAKSRNQEICEVGLYEGLRKAWGCGTEGEELWGLGGRCLQYHDV